MPVTSTASMEGLEARLRRVEDRLEILQLIASYGPSVDSGAARETADIWTQDGSYEYSVLGDTPEAQEVASLNGRETIRRMVEGDEHQGLIGRGAAHFMGIPAIHIDGDEALAVTHSVLLLRTPETGENVVARFGANRWLLVRTAEGWRVQRRTQSLLDGRAAARDILHAGTGHLGL